MSPVLGKDLAPLIAALQTLASAARDHGLTALPFERYLDSGKIPSS